MPERIYLAAMAFLRGRRRRLPTLPAWLVYGWLLTVPWMLQFSTHIMNVSYLLPASLLFFIGALEALPPLRVGAVDVRAAHFMMGFGLLCVVQLHMSWVVLAPFLLAAWCSAPGKGGFAATRPGLVGAGAALPPPFWSAPGGMPVRGGTDHSVRSIGWSWHSLRIATASCPCQLRIARFRRSTAGVFFFSQPLWPRFRGALSVANGRSRWPCCGLVQKNPQDSSGGR